MNANKRQSMKSDQKEGNQIQPKSITFSNQYTCTSSPNLNHIQMTQFQLRNSLDQNMSSQISQIQKIQQPRVFNYETNPQEKNQQNNSKTGNNFDHEPQFSTYSPFRKGESKKDLQSIPQVMKSDIDSVVKGRKILSKDIDVICAVSSDSTNIGIRDLEGRKLLLESTSTFNKDQQRTLAINVNAKSHQVLPLNLVSQSQQLQPQRENSYDKRKLQNRKTSIETKQQRQSSNERNNSKNKRDASQNTRSITHSKQQSDTQQNSAVNSVQRTLRRPNSAKNLKQNTMSNSNVRTLITSPTLTVLQREPSQQQFLPPKPKFQKKQSVKPNEFLYQSLRNHPISSHVSSQNSLSKRVPTASQDKDQTDYNEKTQQENIEQNAFSPLRRKVIDQKMLPSTNKNYRKKIDKSQLLNPNQDHKELNQPSFEESAIRNIHSQGIDEICEQEDSDLSIKLNKQLSKKKFSQTKENYDELVKSIKSHIQNLNLNQLERQKKKTNEKKEKLLKDKEQTRKINFDQLKQQMQKKIEGTQKTNDMKKKKLIQKNLNEEEILKVKKQEQREQWQKEREERHECLEMVRDALKLTSSQNKVREHSKSQKDLQREKVGEQLFIKVPQIVQIETPQNPYDIVMTQSDYRDELNYMNDNNIIHSEKVNNNLIDDFIQKQKRERSKNKINDFDKEKEKEKSTKKELAIVQLLEQQRKKMEIFKQKMMATTKEKLKLGKLRNKQSTEVNNKKTYRSKSKRKIDDEKENRQQSLSPFPHQINSGGKTKSHKKKARKKSKIVQNAQEQTLKQLTQNVQEILDQQSQYSSNKLIGQASQYQSISNLQQFQQDPQIKLMQSLQSMNLSIFNTETQYDYQKLNNKKSDKPAIIQSLQSQELTPIIQSRKKDMRVTASSYQFLQTKPSESTKSLQGISLQNTTPQRQTQQFNQNPVNYQNVIQQCKSPKGEAKSRSNSVKKEKKKFNKQKKYKQKVMSPLSKNQINQNKQVKALKIGKKQGSKQEKIQILSQELQEYNNNKSENPSKKVSDNKIQNVQKVNLIDLLYQSQKQTKEIYLQRQKELLEFQNQAAMKLQKVFRGHLARRLYKEIKNQRQIEQDYLLVKQKYFKNQAQPRKIQEEYKNQAVVQKIDQDHNKSINNSYIENLSNKISKSQASLKDILKKEEEHFKMKQNSTQRKDDQESNSNRSNTQTDNKIFDLQNKVQKRIEYQQNLHKQHEEKTQSIKQLVNIDSISSLHNTNQNYKKNNDEEQYFTISKSQSINLDSLSSADKNVKEENILKNLITKQEVQSKEIKDIQIKNYDSSNQSQNKKDIHLIEYKSDLNERFNLPGQRKSIEERYATSKKKDNKESKQLFFQKLDNAGNHNDEVHSQIFAPASQLNFPTSSEEQNSNWQFERKSFQEFFEQNSKIMQEESKQVPIAMDHFSKQDKSLTKQKLGYQKKLSQYEEMLQVLAKKNEKNKEDLKKLQSKTHLSPSSQKKKLLLERWVTKQEEQLTQKRQWFKDNVNDIISKIDKDLQLTKKKIGSNRKSALKFNTSAEWSHDISIGVLTLNSSIHSTPRITKPPSTENNILKNLQQQISQTDRGETSKRFPFEYKISSNNEVYQKQQQQINQILKRDQEEKKEDIEKNNKQSILSELDRDTKSISTIFDKNDKNIYSQNLFVSSITPNKESSAIIVEVHDKSDILIEDNQHTNEDDESLSKMDPPQFQSPQLSCISPHQQFLQEDLENINQTYFDSLNKKHEQNREVLISTLSPLTLYEKDEQEPLNPFVRSQQEELISIQQQEKQDQQLVDAFLALKEPEQPGDTSKVQQQQQPLHQIEQQADYLTDFILMHLLDSIQSNLFPKRVIIPNRSPSKLNQQEVPQQRNSESDNKSNNNNDNDHQIEEEKLEQSSEINSEQQQAELAVQRPRIRGIKTTNNIVESYLTEVFTKIKQQEDEFVDNLSTPLNKVPQEILLHLQNVYVDSEMENAAAFQQSVLPVDLYLEIERNKQQIQIEDSENEEDPGNKSMLAEWENIHNKVIFDAINEALDNYRPYGLRGPPMPWSQSTRTLTYKNGQQLEMVVQQVKQKVMEWTRTFAGALPCSDLLKEYGIKGPLEEDKLNLLREERLALLLASEIEENEMLWVDYEYEETQTKLDIADMILEVLAEEAAQDLNRIQQNRAESTNNTTIQQ